jgi:hypothetical protein
MLPAISTTSMETRLAATAPRRVSPICIALYPKRFENPTCRCVTGSRGDAATDTAGQSSQRVRTVEVPLEHFRRPPVKTLHVRDPSAHRASAGPGGRSVPLRPPAWAEPCLVLQLTRPPLVKMPRAHGTSKGGRLRSHGYECFSYQSLAPCAELKASSMVHVPGVLPCLPYRPSYMLTASAQVLLDSPADSHGSEPCMLAAMAGQLAVSN